MSFDGIEELTRICDVSVTLCECYIHSCLFCLYSILFSLFDPYPSDSQDKLLIIFQDSASRLIISSCAITSSLGRED